MLAAGDAGSSAGLVLRLGSGAHGPAMGDAYTADATGIASLHYNPAGLGFTARGEAGATYQRLVLDIAQGDLGFAHPINSVSAWGISFNYIDYGKTQRVTLKDIINNNNPSVTFTGRDLVFGASYGRQVNSTLSLGVTAKILNSEIDNVTATAFAADVGLSYRPENLPFRLGISGQNLGTTLKFERVSEDLPALVRGGIAFDFNRVTVAAEVEKVRKQNVTFNGGVEFRVVDMLALRGGFDGRVDSDNGWTAGLGLNIGDLAVDYAYIPFGNLGNNHRVALTYQFGPSYK
ncbi:MAG: hypothetical protein D6679_03255 [Candidatus Hydrogenedentota bacterium]|nr:MAG: hypothetical protein D6679_03255 [Candidatus Hydrogenedentota bacterium]